VKFQLILVTVKILNEKCNQAEEEGCFKEFLHGRISHCATCVLRGA